MQFPRLPRYRTLILFFAIVSGAYLVFEFIAFSALPDHHQVPEVAQKALTQSQFRFQQTEDELISKTLTLSKQIEDAIATAHREDELHKKLNGANFWGTQLFKNETMWLWSGFAQAELSRLQNNPVRIAETFILKENNVTLLGCRTRFTLAQPAAGDTTEYHIVTMQRLQQENLLPFSNLEQSLEETLNLTHSYPVSFSFFAEPEQENTLRRTLRINNVDSVGIAWVNLEDYEKYRQSVLKTYSLIRSLFICVLILFSFLLLFVLTHAHELKKRLLVRVSFILPVWLVFSLFSIPEKILSPFQVLQPELFISFASHAFFITLVYLGFRDFLKRGYLYTPTIGKTGNGLLYLFLGMFFAGLFELFISEIHQLVASSHLYLFGLDIYPSVSTIAFFVVSSVFFTALCLLVKLFVQNIITKARKDYTFVLSGTITGLIFGIILFQIVNGLYTWTSYIALFIFLSITLRPVFFSFFKNNLPELSRPQSLILFLLLMTIAIQSITFEGFKKRQLSRMHELAESFSSETQTNSREITDIVLRNLEFRLDGISSNDIQNRRSAIQNQLLGELSSIIRPEWSEFSLDIQIITPQGTEVAQYSTNLDSPNWTRVFNLPFLEIPYIQERVRKSTNRPILRSKPSAESASRYTAFQRGWIPLYQPGSDEERIAWILCTVYKERPEYDKPIRAVLTALSEQNWQNTYYIYEFQNGALARSAVRGIPVRLPESGKISSQINERLNAENLSYHLTRTIEGQNIREYYLWKDNSRVVKVSSAYPGFNHHVFSVSRFFFLLFISCTLFSWITGAAGISSFQIFGYSRRFQQRLQDRFIYASLFCLSGLILITYHAVSAQNEQLIRSELIKELDTLSEIILEDFLEGTHTQSVATLEELTSPLDVDAALYDPLEVKESTTPQIFEQHLLPEIIPWPVLNDFTLQNKEQITKKSMLGSQNLMIGYKPIYGRDQKLAAILSIPTFLRSPKYNEQILSTTSLLLVLYVILFGIFIVGASVISRQLTKPLTALQDALQKISTGNLEEELPVQSSDEIGELTRAYNEMVSELKELQEELARAEREAAWKEMAQQVAHEIKNPLTPMRLSLQHLERQMQNTGTSLESLKPDISKITDAMIEQIESLSKIASDFARFAKPVEEDFTEVDLRELIIEVEELFSHSGQAEIRFKKEATAVIVSGVKNDLKRVLINLIKNAIEATPEQGTVFINTYIKKGKAIVEIQDTGTGIAIEDREKIFVPNFSTKSSGTGLGLAISKKIIEAHNGEISFETADGEGSKFTFYLPIK